MRFFFFYKKDDQQKRYKNIDLVILRSFKLNFFGFWKNFTILLFG
jgi:hypothetical protein